MNKQKERKRDYSSSVIMALAGLEITDHSLEEETRATIEELEQFGDTLQQYTQEEAEIAFASEDDVILEDNEQIEDEEEIMWMSNEQNNDEQYNFENIYPRQ